MLKLSWIVMDHHVKEGFETYDCITIFLFSFKWVDGGIRVSLTIGCNAKL